MHAARIRMCACTAALLGLLLAPGAPDAMAGDDDCAGAEGYQYLCGPASAEDLVRVPGSRWIIASGFAEGVSLYLVDSQQKTWGKLYPADAPRARQDMERYGACPGSPDPNAFRAHGLNIQPGEGGHSTLYVVGHGEREAIEVFDVDASGEAPEVTWVGCVMTPDGMEANSVAALPDGTLLATIPLHAGFGIEQILAGQPTGAVHAWSPGDAGFTQVEGTEMPYANGIEVSADGSEFYIASSGLLKVLAFSNTNPAQLLRSSEVLSFIPDNLHRDERGRLVTAGMEVNDPVCGDIPMMVEFDFPAFMACHRPFTALAVDPETMQTEVIAASAAHPNFSNITMALQVDDELWVGTFAGDRIAYRTLEKASD